MNMKWGAQFAELGFLGIPGDEMTGHAFGGSEFDILPKGGADDQPLLILTLDLKANEFRGIHHLLGGCSVIPIVSFVNSNAWTEPQEYLFDGQNKTVTWMSAFAPVVLQDAEDRLPNPLPSKNLTLLPMSEQDLPLKEEDYWRIGDDFLGGSKFIRILGAPYWLQQPSQETCKCNKLMMYIASLGYELPGQQGAFGKRPFFIGEAALYFFVCFRCRCVRVTWQST